jgi:hypothetical protein
MVFKDRRLKDGRCVAGWPDLSIPALDGLTPRQASFTFKGRKQLDALLKDMEFQNAQTLEEGDEIVMDPTFLRKELGMEKGD